MSLPRFFLEGQRLDSQGDPCFPLELGSEDLHHFNVLRIKEHEHIAVIDGDGRYFECEVVGMSEDGPYVRITLRKGASAKPFELALFQGLPKQDKMDDIIRHCTEVGVDSFQPVGFSRSVKRLEGKRADKAYDRWSAIAKSAAAQSGRNSIPKVNKVIGMDRAAQLLGSYDGVIVFWEESPLTDTLDKAIGHPSHLVSALSQENASLETPRKVRVAIVIGPEGGISPQEVEMLLNCNPHARLSTLGEFIMRTETASIVASAFVHSALTKSFDAGLGA